MPLLTIFAGPNGSGKSSIIRRAEFEGKHNLLEADAIAKRINPENLHEAAIAAGREVLRRTQQLIAAGQSFAIETTLAGKWTYAAAQAAVKQGFAVNLVYVCVNNPERSIQRVRERVAQGGHDVPDDDVRRRYIRSLENLPPVLKLANRALIYDNSAAEPRLVFETRFGSVIWQTVEHSPWARPLLKGLTMDIK